jgi:hypothetical protein
MERAACPSATFRDYLFVDCRCKRLLSRAQPQNSDELKSLGRCRMFSRGIDKSWRSARVSCRRCRWALELILEKILWTSDLSVISACLSSQKAASATKFQPQRRLLETHKTGSIAITPVNHLRPSHRHSTSTHSSRSSGCPFATFSAISGLRSLFSDEASIG